MSETDIDSIVASDAALARARRQAERDQWLDSHPEDPLPRPIDPDGPVLSVVVTVHNVGPWIDELLESLKAQTLTDVEYLLVDDHSDDHSAAAVDAAAASDPRFTVIRPIDRGGAHARNVGADHARGRLLAFCDGDDIVPETGYAALVAAADGHDIVFGDYLKFFPDRIWHPTRTTFQEPRAGITLADHPDLVHYRAVWNKVFRTAFWREQDIVFPEVVRSNDIVPMITAYLRAASIATITDTVYLYRDRPGNTSMTSKVGTGISLQSYLRQEQACAELLDGHAAQATFHRLFAGRDGWVQVSRYVHELDGDPIDPEILDRVRTLWDLVSPEIREEIPPERKALFDALAGPNPERATDTVLALDPTMAASSPSTWLTAAGRVLEHDPKVLDRIVTGVRRLLLDDPEAARRHATDLGALLRTMDDVHGGTPRKVRNLDVRTHGALAALRDGDVDGFGTRLERARSAVMEVAEATPTRRGLRLSGTISGPDDLMPEHIVVRDEGQLHRVAAVRINPDDRTQWSADIDRPSLPRRRKHRLDVVGRFQAGDELFHLAHAEHVTQAESPVPGATVEFLASSDPFVCWVRWSPRASTVRRAKGALRRRLLPWIQGARPRTLPAAVAPVLAGTGAAALANGVVAWKALVALGVSLALQVGVNYANDYSDGIRGTDDDRVGPLRLVGSGAATPRAVKRAAQLALLIGAVLGLVLVVTTSWWLLLIGAAALLAAWTYTGGANPYGYRGLGEVSVFVFFGLVAVVGTTFVQLERVTWPSVAAGVTVGALACAILVANNLRDIATDVVAGKRTVAVRLGDARTRWLYLGLGLLAWAGVVACGLATPWALLGLAGLVLWAPAANRVRSGAGGLELVPVLAQTGVAELVAAAGLALGFTLGG